jgi:hypothetical protein
MVCQNFLSKKTKNDEIEALSTAPQFARVALESGMNASVGHFYTGKGIKEMNNETLALTEFMEGCEADRLCYSIEPGEFSHAFFLPAKCENIRDNSFSHI